MKFFRKRYVAWFFAICMIVAAVWIGQYKQQQNVYRPACETEAEKWAWENHAAYEHHIVDEADLLPAEIREQISVYNGTSDYLYDVVCGVRVLQQTDVPGVQSELLFSQLQLSSRDALLVLDPEKETWHMEFGSAVTERRQHDLKLLANEIGTDLFRSDGKGVLKLFSNLEQWDETHLSPIRSSNHLFRFAKFIGKTAWNVILISLLIGAAFIGVIVYLIVKACRRKAPAGSEHSVHRASERQTADQRPKYTSQRRHNKDEQ